MGTLLAATGVRTEYEWTFDTGAGAQARGKVNEKRRSFDGWARTAAYEGLVARPELNGAIGVLLGEVEVDSGRAPVKLMAPPEHAGKTLKTKRDNLICL
ncbi:hypothetical protein Ctob_008064 [Chrysochromulina tobinii]|uniref:Uncharacterized protein n=1 Tax=Chrysochromulina tobinii TaxID=1460289 RepID=A0A0M0JX24_9EUKA|nr:hypothetical protein Ctob_008064 [Chrysochromulina tobinii]|eukprot:KOO30688.1 hypothetical protein Ctob_008064 [Chrysochromulina sp. CCMP291]